MATMGGVSKGKEDVMIDCTNIKKPINSVWLKCDKENLCTNMGTSTKTSTVITDKKELLCKETNNIEIDNALDLKAQKKKLKKLRQKERKKNDNVKEKETKPVELNVKQTEHAINEEVTELKPYSILDIKHSDKSKLEISNKNRTENVSEEYDEDDEEINFLHNMTFLSTILKTKKSLQTDLIKNKKIVNAADTSNVNHDIPNVLDKMQEGGNVCDDEDSFIFVKSKRTKHKDSKISNYDDSNSLGTKAIKLILENNLSQAIKCLSEAVRVSSSDVRHYINRSFCYLRKAEYALAVQDARFVIDNTKDTLMLGKAKCILGRAACGLKNYEVARESLQACVSLFPNNAHIYWELLRIRVVELVELGFNETSILSILNVAPSVLDAIELLSDAANDSCNNGMINCSYHEDEIFYSDNDDEFSNTGKLFKMMGESHPNYVISFCNDMGTVAQKDGIIKRKVSKNKSNLEMQNKRKSGKKMNKSRRAT